LRVIALDGHRRDAKVSRTDAGGPRRARSCSLERGTTAMSPVDSYLRSRGLTLPPEAIGEAVRYDPDCPFAGTRTPAMVCLVRNIITNEPRAIHRTALTLDGRKVKVNGHDRLSLLGRSPAAPSRSHPTKT
jgi:hypothetical protein